MPLYDQVCVWCGEHEAFCSSDEREVCEKCGEPCVVKPSIFHAQGIIFEEESSKQLGVTWSSNKEKREWMKAHPNVSAVSKGSQEDRIFGATLKDKAETAVKRAGFNDVQDFQSKHKERKAAEAAEA